MNKGDQFDYCFNGLWALTSMRIVHDALPLGCAPYYDGPGWALRLQPSAVYLDERACGSNAGGVVSYRHNWKHGDVWMIAKGYDIELPGIIEAMACALARFPCHPANISSIVVPVFIENGSHNLRGIVLIAGPRAA